MLSIESFGFKNGVPREADLMFDVRFLPNPYFIPHLKEKNGLDAEVVEYIRGLPESLEFLDHLTNFLRYLIPKYVAEGKAYLTICIGCTGGQHRSVVMAVELAAAIKDLGYAINVKHRSLERG